MAATDDASQAASTSGSKSDELPVTGMVLKRSESPASDTKCGINYEIDQFTSERKQDVGDQDSETDEYVPMCWGDQGGKNKTLEMLIYIKQNDHLRQSLYPKPGEGPRWYTARQVHQFIAEHLLKDDPKYEQVWPKMRVKYALAVKNKLYQLFKQYVEQFEIFGNDRTGLSEEDRLKNPGSYNMNNVLNILRGLVKQTIPWYDCMDQLCHEHVASMFNHEVNSHDSADSTVLGLPRVSGSSSDQGMADRRWSDDVESSPEPKWQNDEGEESDQPSDERLDVEGEESDQSADNAWDRINEDKQEEARSMNKRYRPGARATTVDPRSINETIQQEHVLHEKRPQKRLAFFLAAQEKHLESSPQVKWLDDEGKKEEESDQSSNNSWDGMNEDKQEQAQWATKRNLRGARVTPVDSVTIAQVIRQEHALRQKRQEKRRALLQAAIEEEEADREYKLRPKKRRGGGDCKDCDRGAV